MEVEVLGSYVVGTCGGGLRKVGIFLSQETGHQLKLKVLVCGILCTQRSPLETEK